MTKTYLFQKYIDGETPEDVGLLLDALPYVARDEGCAAVGGYVPSLEWVIALHDERKETYQRATATEQWEYAWRNAGYAQ